MNPVVYFAEPIDADRRVTQEQQLRNSMLATLLRHGMAVYRPAAAWQTGSTQDPWASGVNAGTARVVEGVNRSALGRAHLMVARWPKTIHSVGVPMEIEYATNTLGLKVILFSNRVDSVSLAANPLIEIVHDEWQFEKAVAHWVRSTPVFGSRKTEMRFSGPDGAMNRAHEGDAGFDLIVSEDAEIGPGEAVMVPCDTAVELPPGVFGWVVARSSTYERYDVTILPGIIDTDYRGKLYAVALAASYVDTGKVFIPKGSRIAQLVLLPNVAAGIQPVRVDEVSTDTTRGSNGFGSTGV